MSDAGHMIDRTGERGRRLYELFARALEVPAESRVQFLKAECDDEELRAEVGRMLIEDDQADDFLEVTHPAIPASCTDALVGSQIGGYRIEEWIASGGMGSVYRAMRVNDFRQSVALKIARPGYSADQTFHRFETERQILADLNHPFIAQILDGGTSEQGQPYFVMEFIPGRAIDRYCREEDVSLRERIRLLTQVCRAVQHAHERGIVHRDVKPGNILVSDDGIPKLTDFGIARWFEEDSGQTQTGMIVGTPSYSSPEQASGRRTEVGPPSDVFSLGAVLYRLLTGESAFQGETWQETIDLVCRIDPIPPRTHCSVLPVALEAICLKCLEKEPRCRYESAGHLADDLQRWLDRRPVQARPVGPLRRWVRRIHRERISVAAASLAGIAVVALIGLVAWMLIGGGRGMPSHAAASALEPRPITHESQGVAQQSPLLRTQQERARRLAFVSELAKIHAVCDSRPDLAREWLADPERCPPDLRNFAWHHLQRRASRHITRIHCRQSYPLAMEFLPDDGRLASLSQSRLRFWEVTTGAQVMERIGPAAGVVFLGRSADGSVLLAPRPDGNLSLFQSDGAETEVEVATPIESRTCAAVTNDGAVLAIGSSHGAIELWDVAQARALATWAAHAERVYCLKFSSGGETLVSYGCDAEIRTWHVRDGTLLATCKLDVGRRQFQELARAADRLAVGELYGKVTVWECGSGTLLLGLPDDGGGISRVALSPDGRILAATANRKGTGGDYSQINIWDVPSKAQELEWTVPSVQELTFSNGGNLLATASATDGGPVIDIWDVRERVGVDRLPRELTDGTQSIAWVGGDTRILCGTSDGALNLIDLEGQTCRELFHYSGAVRNVAVTRDGRTASATVAADAHLLPLDSSHEITRASVFKTGDVPGGVIKCAAFSTHGQRFATGTRNGAIHVWKLRPQQLVRQLQAPQTVAGLAFSPDGLLLASGGRDTKLTLWDLETGEPVATMDGHTAHVLCVAFSTTGRLIASADRDGIIHLWDLEQHERVGSLSGHSDSVLAITFSPDGLTLASGGRDGTIRIWDVESCAQQLALEGHTKPVVDVEFSPGGRFLASCDEDGAVLVWNGDAER